MATVAEDGQALGLAPIVDDMGEQICAGGSGNALEEVAGFDRDAIR